MFDLGIVAFLPADEMNNSSGNSST
jgi:hypothetical protein